MKDAKAIAWTRQARLQNAGNVEILKAWIPPTVDFEISYDIEDYSLQDSVYLHGLLVRESAAKKPGATRVDAATLSVYTPVCLRVDETEEDLWKRFLNQLETFEARGTYAVYVYSHHEATQLAKLEAKFGGSPALNAFRARFVDLYAALKGAIALPTESYSLKTVARYIGFSWRDAEPGGAESMAWWADYLKAPTANLSSRQRVLDYNEDDTRAALAVKDWLEHTAR